MRRKVIDNTAGLVTDVVADRDGNTIIREVQDVEPILDHNKRLQTEDATKTEIRPIASIPFGTLLKWLREDGIPASTMMQWTTAELKAYCAKRYMSNEWQYLRTSRKPQPRMVVPEMKRER